MPPRGWNPPVKKLTPAVKSGQKSAYDQYLEQKAKADAHAQYVANQQKIAQQRRNQAEQAARIAEQKRRDALVAQQARQKQALDQRNKMLQERERKVQHQVSKYDSPESIAAKYNTTPAAVAGAAGQRLITGTSIQVLAFDKRSIPLAERSSANRAKTLIEKFVGRIYHGVPEKFNEFMEPGERPITSTSGRDVSGIPNYDYFGDATRGREFDRYASSDRSKAEERSLQASYAAMTKADIAKSQEGAIANENRRRGDFGAMMRYTGQSIAWAYLEKKAGNPDWKNGRVNYMTQEMIDAFPPNIKIYEVLNDLGYTEIQLEDGTMLWVPIDIEEEGYGMGGYSYPGYGGGGYSYPGYGGGIGGIGGEYKPTPRGSTRVGAKGGGRASMKQKALFAGSIPTPHWRI